MMPCCATSSRWNLGATSALVSAALPGVCGEARRVAPPHAEVMSPPATTRTTPNDGDNISARRVQTEGRYGGGLQLSCPAPLREASLGAVRHESWYVVSSTPAACTVGDSGWYVST